MKIKLLIIEYFKKAGTGSTISTMLHLEPEIIPPEFQSSSKLRDEPVLTKVIREMNKKIRIGRQNRSDLTSNNFPNGEFEDNIKEEVGEQDDITFSESKELDEESSLRTVKISTLIKKEDRAVMKLPEFLNGLKKKEVERIFHKYSNIFVSKRDMYSMFIMLKLLIGTQPAYNKAKKVLYNKYVSYFFFNFYFLDFKEN